MIKATIPVPKWTPSRGSSQSPINAPIQPTIRSPISSEPTAFHHSAGQPTRDYSDNDDDQQTLIGQMHGVCSPFLEVTLGHHKLVAFFFAVLKNLSASSTDGSSGDDDSTGDKRNNDDGGDSSHSDDGSTDDDDDSTKLRLEPRCQLRLRR